MLKTLRMVGSAMLVKKAVTAKRKLANVPKRTASAHNVLASSGVAESALRKGSPVSGPGLEETGSCLAKTRPASGDY